MGVLFILRPLNIYMNEFDSFLHSISYISPRLIGFVKSLGFEHHNVTYIDTNAATVKVDGLTMHFFVKGDYASFTVFNNIDVLDAATFKWTNNEWRENDV